MAYKIYNIKGEEITLADLQDKGPWCLAGASYEQVFVDRYGRDLGLIINPAKELNPYVPDLIYLQTNNLADLKTQNTPFFQSNLRFGIDPQYAVTFNLKDFKRYKQYYPNIDVYFWVSWIATRFVSTDTINVSAMEGIWMAPLTNIEAMINEGAPIHSYQQRRHDEAGNAKASYVLDLRDELFRRIR